MILVWFMGKNRFGKLNQTNERHSELKSLLFCQMAAHNTTCRTNLITAMEEAGDK